MADNQVEILIPLPLLTGIALGYGPLVERMPNADIGQHRQTAHPSFITEFIHHARVGHKATASLDFRRYLVGYDATQIAGMHMLGVEFVIDHLLAYFVDATLHGPGQSAPADDGVKIQWLSVLLQFVHHKLTSEVQLSGNRAQGMKLLGSMLDVAYQQRSFILIYSYLG